MKITKTKEKLLFPSPTKYSLNKIRALIIVKYFNNFGVSYNNEVVFRKFEFKEEL